MARPGISKELSQKLRLYFVEVCERDNKVPEVEIFRNDLVVWQSGKDKQKNQDCFIKRFGKIKIPSKAWFDKKENLPIWRKNWEDQKNNPSMEDLPWHLGTTSEFQVRPEVIPTLLSFQNNQSGNLITIRNAKWISRLFNCFMVEENGQVVVLERDLITVSQFYSTKESLCQKAELPFDSTHYDRLLFEKRYDNLIASFLEDINQQVEKRTVSNAEYQKTR